MKLIKFNIDNSMLNIDCEQGLKINGVSLLDMIYPVGSLYISKENVSPAADFGGSWLCIAEDVALPLGDNAPVIGNGITLGLTNGEQLLGLQMNNSLVPYNNAYGGPIGDGNYGTPAYNQRQLGVTTDAAKSGVIANLSQSTSAVKVYVFRRIA